MANETTLSHACKRENSVGQPERVRSGRVYSPNVDIVELENELLLLADVPGVKPDDVEISYEQGLLTLHARVQPRQDEDKTDYVAREYGMGDFYRSFQIGEGIDPEKIEADLKSGVLTVKIAKRPDALPRKIKVGGD